MDINLYVVLKQTFICSSIVIMILGIIFIIVPEYVLRNLNKVDKWVSTEGYFNFINSSRDTEKKFYKYNKIFSLFLFISSIYVLYVLTLSMESKSLIAFFPESVPALMAPWLAQSIIYILVTFNVLALFLSIILFIRPSALKELEQLSNRWLKSESSVSFLDRTVETTNNITASKLRFIGIFTVLGCIYILYRLL